MNICLFCGSAEGKSHHYIEDATKFGHAIAERGDTLIYGGAKVGIMGAVADAILENNGSVIGIIPRVLADKEISHTGLTQLIEVNSMHERKALMARRGDAFAILPGGCGTLEEFFEMWTWVNIGIQDKPFAFLNTNQYFIPLFDLIKHILHEGFITEKFVNSLLCTEDINAIFNHFDHYTPIGDKW